MILSVDRQEWTAARTRFQAEISWCWFGCIKGSASSDHGGTDESWWHQHGASCGGRVIHPISNIQHCMQQRIPCLLWREKKASLQFYSSQQSYCKWIMRSRINWPSPPQIIPSPKFFPRFAIVGRRRSHTLKRAEKNWRRHSWDLEIIILRLWVHYHGRGGSVGRARRVRRRRRPWLVLGALVLVLLLVQPSRPPARP